MLRIAFVICGLVGVASAQPATACFPECRAGFVCNNGACVTACNPACAAGELCSPAGQCVSACNPPCGAGATCTADRQCVAAPARPQDLGPADPGWAKGAAVFGYVSAGVIAALAAGAIATNNSDADDIAAVIGGVGIVYTAASIPIVALGGRSARSNPAVRGVLALRIVGWIGYGLTMMDATALVILLLGENQYSSSAVQNIHIASVGVLGSATAVVFAFDAGISASQAETIAASRGARAGLTLSPRFTVTKTAAREHVPLLTLSGTF